eukprot:TRINITY_DN1420_c0_g1_i1.p1 TRINITY_DN1420_c0_g1~~TRINITY_DN1420_c0_g1_i1.p1  ORF type:complete len:450 (+),score=61.48 TRINITY_DN1420_c0_g1_i1:33-1352(+)
MAAIQHFRVIFHAQRHEYPEACGATALQLGQIALGGARLEEISLAAARAVCTSAGWSPPNEGAENLLRAGSKFARYGDNVFPVVVEVDLGAPVAFQAYALCTALDSPWRDPITWQFQAKIRNQWVALHTNTAAPPPLQRGRWTEALVVQHVPVISVSAPLQLPPQQPDVHQENYAAYAGPRRHAPAPKPRLAPTVTPSPTWPAPQFNPPPAPPHVWRQAQPHSNTQAHTQAQTGQREGRQLRNGPRNNRGHANHTSAPVPTPLPHLRTPTNQQEADRLFALATLLAEQNAADAALARAVATSSALNFHRNWRNRLHYLALDIDNMGYEQLLALEEEIGCVKVGVKAEVLQQVTQQIQVDETFMDELGEQRDCAICMEEYCVGAAVRKLPCAHIFCAECIDKWLSESKKCPTCRSEVSCDPGTKSPPEATSVALQQSFRP